MERQPTRPPLAIPSGQAGGRHPEDPTGAQVQSIVSAYYKTYFEFFGKQATASAKNISALFPKIARNISALGLVPELWFKLYFEWSQKNNKNLERAYGFMGSDSVNRVVQSQVRLHQRLEGHLAKPPELDDSEIKEIQLTKRKLADHAPYYGGDIATAARHLLPTLPPIYLALTDVDPFAVHLNLTKYQRTEIVRLRGELSQDAARFSRLVQEMIRG